MAERVCNKFNFDSMIADERKSCLRKQLSKDAKTQLIEHLKSLHTSLHSRGKGELYHSQKGGGSSADHEKMFRRYLQSLYKKLNGCEAGRISASELITKLSVNDFKKSGGGLFGPSQGKKLPNGCWENAPCPVITTAPTETDPATGKGFYPTSCAKPNNIPPGYQLDREASIPPVCKGGGDKKSGGFRKSRGDRWGTSMRCPDSHPYETPDGNCTNVPPSGGALPSQKSRGARWGTSMRCPDSHPYETPDGNCTNVPPAPAPRIQRSKAMPRKPPAPTLQRSKAIPKYNPSTNPKIPRRPAPKNLPAPPAKLSLFQRAKKFVTGKAPVVTKNVKSVSIRAKQASAPAVTKAMATVPNKPRFNVNV